MKTFGIILLSLVGLFVLMMIVGSLIGEHDRTEEAKIPWADMSFLVSGGEVMANNKEAYDLKDCTIIQYTGSADYWSAEHISIPAKKSSAVLEPSQFSNGSETLNPFLHKTQLIQVYCDTAQGKRRSGAVIK